MFANRKLYLNKESPDVTLVVDGEELPAHRSILAERSEYFRTMFSNHFVEFDSDKIILKEVNLFAFNIVLEYIYVHYPNTFFILQYTQDQQWQIFVCAQYFMVDSLVEQLRKRFENRLEYFPLETLNLAHRNHATDFILYADRIIPKIAPFKITNKIFAQLLPVTVEHLLKLKLNTDDFTIFEALVCWMRGNRKYSDWFPELLKLFDLYLLNEPQLYLLFEPVELVDRNFCQSLLTQQREQAIEVQKVVNETVIDPTSFRVIQGERNTGFPTEVTSMDGIIIIDLKQLFLINCIKLFLRSNPYYYTVLVSRDMRNWEKVIDHSKYECNFQQQLFFNERPVRFVRIQMSDFSFHFIYHYLNSLGRSASGVQKLIEQIEVLYSTDPLESDPATTFTIPQQNVVQTTKKRNGFYSFSCGFSAFSDNDSYDSERRLDLRRANIRNRLEDPINGYIGHKLGSLDGIVYKFEQPYIIGSMKLLLKQESSYYIAISMNDSDWTRVFAEENVSGWRIATFEKQPVLYIRIYGTNAPSDFFNLYKLECPATF